MFKMTARNLIKLLAFFSGGGTCLWAAATTDPIQASQDLVNFWGLNMIPIFMAALVILVIPFGFVVYALYSRNEDYQADNHLYSIIYGLVVLALLGLGVKYFMPSAPSDLPLTNTTDASSYFGNITNTPTTFSTADVISNTMSSGYTATYQFPAVDAAKVEELFVFYYEYIRDEAIANGHSIHEDAATGLLADTAWLATSVTTVVDETSRIYHAYGNYPTSKDVRTIVVRELSRNFDAYTGDSGYPNSGYVNDMVALTDSDPDFGNMFSSDTVSVEVQ